MSVARRCHAAFVMILRLHPHISPRAQPISARQFARAQFLPPRYNNGDSVLEGCVFSSNRRLRFSTFSKQHFTSNSSVRTSVGRPNDRMNSSTVLSALLLLNWASWIAGQSVGDQQCGGDFYTDNYDTISSPGFPGAYTPGDDCIWHLRVPEGHMVQLTFAYLGTDPWPLAPQNCARHYVEVFDSPDQGGALLGRYCGDITPPVVLSSGNSLSVKFITSKWSTNIQGFHGFKAKFASIPVGSIVESGCRSPRKNTYPIGTLTSIHFPSDYDDIVCKWEVLVEPGQNITLKLRSFHVGGVFPLKPLCDAETGRLTVHDGVGSDKNHLVSICGRMSDEETYSVTTVTNQMTVEFRAGNTGPYKGFFATYESSGYQAIDDVTTAQRTGSAHALRAYFPWCLSCLFAAAILLLRMSL